jgi:hypothetical protein
VRAAGIAVRSFGAAVAMALEFTMETNGLEAGSPGRVDDGLARDNWVKLRRPTFIFAETWARTQLEPERSLT